ncbi:MAG TPA: hypothetical protein PLA59_09990 [Myxococcota bacterium]|nr:hypothetical protein [Myxococcota bacterium]HOS62722.1 hypothetical protein [Myxococcota bacterium]HPC92823.1 hypothetical protein [Myxococcota bacterium]HPL25862.1 hypothetical protein [Myxococcota bacterium]HQE74255.1 hypothetical protein [Myxococcota bacterium]
MYSSLPSFVLAFHGCDADLKRKVLLSEDALKKSHNEYDWLGHGIYFWENDPDRALSYAEIIRDNPKRCNYPIKNPAVLGAIIDLKYCLNLFEERALGYLRESYNILESLARAANDRLPENKRIDDEGDVLVRKLDCAVFEMLHKYRRERKLKEFDSVRSPFWEGKEIYPNSGFREKNHIQICVRNLECIKGYFDPMKLP